jgi:alpha-tubulin suppressor-like RCC1 family protein
MVSGEHVSTASLVQSDTEAPYRDTASQAANSKSVQTSEATEKAAVPESDPSIESNMVNEESTPPPALHASDLSDIIQVTAGMGHSCAMTSLGAVYCWGANKNGQLGIGYISDCEQVPVRVPGILEAALVEAGGVHTCVLERNGRVLCFGSNEFGQLGNSIDTSLSSPTVVDGLPAIRHLVADTAQTCAISDDAEVFCWGYHAGADVNVDQSYHPIKIGQNIKDAVDISVGEKHLCVLTSRDSVLCRGDNAYGQVFGRNDTPILQFKRIPDIQNAFQVVSGNNHNCVVQRRNGKVSCWGINLLGEVQPQSDASTFRRPMSIKGLGPVKKLSAAPGHTCALTQKQKVVCWGPIYGLQLGVNVEDIDDDTPLVEVPTLEDVVDVSTGDRHTCLVLENGHVQCFGENNYGQLGDGAPQQCSTQDPLPNSFGRTEGQIGRHSLEILRD